MNKVDAVSRDLDRYLNEQGDYERWFEQNEDDLVVAYFEKTGLTSEEDEAGFNKYAERRWQDSVL